MSDCTVKYGSGYVTLDYGDGKQIKVTVEEKKTLAGAWRPFPIKDVAKLAEALQ